MTLSAAHRRNLFFLFFIEAAFVGCMESEIGTMEVIVGDDATFDWSRPERDSPILGIKWTYVTSGGQELDLMIERGGQTSINPNLEDYKDRVARTTRNDTLDVGMILKEVELQDNHTFKVTVTFSSGTPFQALTRLIVTEIDQTHHWIIVVVVVVIMVLDLIIFLVAKCKLLPIVLEGCGLILLAVLFVLIFPLWPIGFWVFYIRNKSVKLPGWFWPLTILMVIFFPLWPLMGWWIVHFVILKPQSSRAQKEPSPLTGAAPETNHDEKDGEKMEHLMEKNPEPVDV